MRSSCSRPGIGGSVRKLRLSGGRGGGGVETSVVAAESDGQDQKGKKENRSRDKHQGYCEQVEVGCGEGWRGGVEQVKAGTTTLLRLISFLIHRVHGTVSSAVAEEIASDESVTISTGTKVGQVGCVFFKVARHHDAKTYLVQRAGSTHSA